MSASAPAYGKRYRLDRHRGINRSPLPVERVRRHVQELVDQGWSQRHIAEAAGCGPTTITTILRATNAGVQRDTALALLRVSLSTSRQDPRAFVPKTGTIRRIQALLRMGWTHEQMHHRSGVRTHIVLSQAGRWVSAAKHQAIVDLYDQLAMTRGTSSRTASRAAKAGYLPPLAWDDDTLDDPTATPAEPDGAHLGVDDAAVQRRLAGDHTVRLTRAERLAVVQRLYDQGLNDPEIARAAGLHARQVFRDRQVLGLATNAPSGRHADEAAA